MKHDEEREPKPYQLIPLPKGSIEEARKSIKETGHDRARAGLLTGWVELALFTRSPIQVATGITDFVRITEQREQLALMQFAIDRVDKDDPNLIETQVMLPGSSIKGAVRSLVEAISPSCMLIVGSLTRMARPRHLIPCKGEKLCPACRMFGTQDYQGQVSFADAEVPQGNLSLIGTPLLWSPARSEGRGLPPSYMIQGQARGRKVYEHRLVASGPDPRLVIRDGTAIPIRIDFTNLSEAEIGLLLASLGQHPQHRFPIKLGAGKPIGMGSVDVRITTIILAQTTNEIRRAGRLGKAKTQELTGSNLIEAVAKWTSQAAAEKLTPQLAEVVKTLHPDKLKQDAPSGIY